MSIFPSTPSINCLLQNRILLFEDFVNLFRKIVCKRDKFWNFGNVKLPGWLSNLNALLAKKFPKFLSHLNEIGDVDGKVEWNSVGFFVLWSLLCGLSVDFLGVVFACGYSGVRVAMFGVVTAEASQSEKLREWDGLFACCECEDECSN